MFTFPKTNGWNALPLLDCTLSPNSILLVECVDVTSAQLCGEPYVLLHDDGRLVGKTTTILGGRGILSAPPAFPKWAEWKTHVHGVCGLGGSNRSATTGQVEALNEERFFLSELYMILPQILRTQEDDGSHYRLRMWQTQISAHIPPLILKNIRHGSVCQCLKQQYLQCPLLKPRPDHPFANLCIHAGTETGDTISVAVTVTGRRISNVCPPSNSQITFETYSDAFFQSTESGVDFAEYFKRCPIQFHRDLFALR